MPPCPGDVQWFPAEIRRLIVAIKKHEALYNPRNESFGLRDLQARAWRSVAEQVGGGKTDLQCRDKWNCLRGTYRRHVRTEATNAVKRRSGWPWADMMSFIKPFVMDKEDLPDSVRNGSNTPPASKPGAIVVTNPSVKPAIPHQPHCPMTSKLKTVNISTANGVPGSGTLTFAGGLYPGGIIFNTKGVGIGIVQPNQANVIGVVQPSQPLSLIQPNQTPVNLGIVQTSQPSAGVGKVQPTVTNVVTRNLSDSNSASVKPKPGTPNPDPIHVDEIKIKRDPDTPDLTEFVDMETAIKKEPIEDDELQLPEEFNFLPEDSPQENSQESVISNRESGVRSPNKDSGDQNQENIDSNELFMRSTVSHMRKLSAYDQSVFKLKVQQLLHEMMFPRQP